MAGTGMRNQLKVAACVDVWLDPQAPSALGNLLGFMREWAKRESIDLIEVPHFDAALGGQLRGLGLLHRTFSNEQPSYYKAPEAGELDPAATYLVTAQGDRGL